MLVALLAHPCPDRDLLSSTPPQDMSQAAQRMVDLVLSLNQRHPQTYVLDVWRGSASQQVRGLWARWRAHLWLPLMTLT